MCSHGFDLIYTAWSGQQSQPGVPVRSLLFSHFIGVFKEYSDGQGLLIFAVCPLKVVWNGQPCEDRQTLVPHVEHRTDGLSESDVEGVQVL